MRARRGGRRLHVLQVVHAMGIGGTERVVRDLARHFENDQFRTSVACLDALGAFGEELRAAGMPTHVLGRRPGVDVRVAIRLARVCRAGGVDIIHAHQYTPYFYAAAACLLVPRVKVVFTEHGRFEPDVRSVRRVVWNRLLRGVTAGVTAVSEFTRERLVACERIPRARIEVIYNGVDVDGADAAPPREASRAVLGLPPHGKVVLSVGRLDRVKDFGTLIRAMAKVVIDVPDAILLIAGDGDATYRHELVEISDALGIASRVRFLGSRRDVSTLLAACDVFALTSITEATSMTILEAMSAGRPVVATSVGGNPELVVPRSTGTLVPAGDSGATAEALAELLTDPDRAGRLGLAGRRRVTERFTRTAAFAAYEQIYRKGVGA